MWIFGRKANRQPTNPDVPPELQQYYRDTSWRSRFRGARLYILPAMAAVVLVAAIVGGILWLQHHNANEITSKKPDQTANQQAQQSQGSKGASGTNTPGTSQPPATLPSDNTQAPATPAGGTASNNQPATGGGNVGGVTTPTTVPNTGPDDGVLLLSLAAGVIGAAAFHARQLRLARR